MPKLEVTWTSRMPDGEKRHVCARTRGDRWIFQARARRHDDWLEVASPPLEDWLELLDGVRRRAGRHFATSDDVTRLLSHVRRLFPGEKVE